MSFLTEAFKAIGGGSALLGGVSTALSVAQFVNGRNQARAQEAVGAQNLALAEVEARQAEISALDQIRIRRRQAQQDVGRQRASFAASGVAVDEGSPLLAYAETVANAEMDVAAIRERASLDAWRARMSGTIKSSTARSLASATRTSAGFDLLTTGVKFADRVVRSTGGGVKIE